MKRKTLKITVLISVSLIIFLGFKIDFYNKSYFKGLENNLIKIDALKNVGTIGSDKMHPVTYACNHEITNDEYRMFLNYLKANKMDSLYKICLMDSTLWVKEYTYAFNEPMMNMYNWHPAYDNYPAVGMKYEGALEYCKWLTKVYNEYPDKKFKKVVFRLPDELEWMYAAKGMPDMILPWFGAYAYDAKEKYYCNIRCGLGNYSDDGGAQTLVIGHYKPNKIGLYDVIGNVSEMATGMESHKKDSLVIKGGSWADEIQDCYITKKQNYKAPSCRIGFRVFMEVVE